MTLHAECNARLAMMIATNKSGQAAPVPNTPSRLPEQHGRTLPLD